MVLATMVVFGVLGLARMGYGVVLPPMQADLGLDNTQAGALATANLVGYLLLAAVGGALASRFGPRAVITAGLTLAGLGMVLTGWARGFAGAALWRAVSGVGSGAGNVPAMGLLSAWFGPRRRGLASGVAVAGSSVALILLGPTVPPILAAYGDAGWRVCWFGFGGATLLVALLAGLFLRNRPGEMGLSPVGVSTDLASPPAPSGPIQWHSVYRSRAVWYLGLVYTAYGFSYIIYMTFFVKSLVADGGYTPAAAGRLFMFIGWASLLCGLMWGAISDALGRKAALVMIYSIQSASFGLFGLWPTPWGFTLSAILFGLTAWSIPAVMAAACGDMLGPRLAPAALGFITLFLGVGQAVGPTVAGAVADATGSLLPAMLLPCVMSLLGAVGAAFIKPSRAVEEPPAPH